jgi:phosphate/sulfate permease
MRMRRMVRSTSAFVTQMGAAMVKAVVTSLALGILVVSVMQYIGVPVPTAHDLWGGVSRLTRFQ